MVMVMMIYLSHAALDGYQVLKEEGQYKYISTSTWLQVQVQGYVTKHRLLVLVLECWYNFAGQFCGALSLCTVECVEQFVFVELVKHSSIRLYYLLLYLICIVFIDLYWFDFVLISYFILYICIVSVTKFVIQC